jgi:two-component system chemotaxis sensor kinase CheA
VVVVEAAGEHIGFLVDSYDSPQEIMVKPVDGYLTARGAITGVSVMGDGRIALVLDPVGLVHLALEHAHDKSTIGLGVLR